MWAKSLVSTRFRTQRGGASMPRVCYAAGRDGVSSNVAAVSLSPLRFLRLRPWLTALRVEGGRDLEITGDVGLPGPGLIRFGRGVRLLARGGAIELRAHEGGEIRIDDGAEIDAGASI